MENKETTSSPRLRRTAAAAVTAVLAVALTLTGTLAWNAMADKVNKFANEGDKAAVLHDDFEGGPDKHVFVENTSKSTEIFVRVRLQEFMDLTSHSDRPLGPGDWTAHAPATAVGDCGLTNAASEKFHDNFAWTMGGGKWYLPQPPGTSGTAPSDLNVYGPATPGARQAPNAQVVSMNDYLAMDFCGQEAYVGWIYDVDGWAYWSRLLPAGEATGLLLQKVTPAPGLGDIDYFYAINVAMESVDRDDLPMWTKASGNNDGLGQPSVTDGRQAELSTGNAAYVLNEILERIFWKEQGFEVVAIEVIDGPFKKEYLPGEIFDPRGIILEITYANGRHDFLLSGITVPDNGPLEPGTTSVTIALCGLTAQVPITVSESAHVADMPATKRAALEGRQ